MIRIIVTLTIAAAGALLAGCGLEGPVTFGNTIPDSALYSTSATTASPTLSREDIGDTAKRSMQETFDTDSQFAAIGPIKVLEVLAVQEDGNKYRGLATIRGAGGTERGVPIDITVDGNVVLWQTEPGVLDWLALDAQG